MISGIQNTSASIAQLANQSQGPKQSQESPNESVTQGGGEDYQQKARSKGIPEAVIQQGKQAARQWLAENKQVAADTAENSTDRVSSSQKAANDKSETLLDTFV